MSSDSEIDQESIQQALNNFKKSNQNLKVECVDLQKLEKDSKIKNKSLESDDETLEKEKSTGCSRPTKYVHVNRREEIKVILNF
jgi:hypothetical protein